MVSLCSVFYKKRQNTFLRYSIFDIRFLQFLFMINPAVALVGGWADT
jgi:hypothetical protein